MVLDSRFPHQQVRNIKEGVHGYEIIYELHARIFPPSCFRALGRSDSVTQISLLDLFRIALSMFDSEEALQGKEVRHAWNPIVNKEFRSGRTASAIVPRCAVLVKKSAARVPSCDRCWVADETHPACET